MVFNIFFWLSLVVNTSVIRCLVSIMTDYVWTEMLILSLTSAEIVMMMCICIAYVLSLSECVLWIRTEICSLDLMYP